MSPQVDTTVPAHLLLEDLVGSFTSQRNLAGLGGEDSLVFAVSPVFDGSFVAKHPRARTLDCRAEQLAIATAKALQVPFVIARVEDKYTNADVASIVFNQKLTSLTEVLGKKLFPPTLISGVSQERHSFDDRLKALDYLVNKKIVAQVACIQNRVLPDFDFCNVGYSPTSRTIQLFDFGGIRTGVTINGLTAGSAYSLAAESAAMSQIDISTLHNHSDQIAYRAIRIRDCYTIAATLSPQLAMHQMPECPYAQGVWEKYSYLEAQARKNQLPIPRNPGYTEGQAQLGRLAKYFEQEAIAGAIDSLNRHCGSNMRPPHADSDSSGYALSFVES